MTRRLNREAILAAVASVVLWVVIVLLLLTIFGCTATRGVICKCTAEGPDCRVESECSGDVDVVVDDEEEKGGPK